MDKKQGMTIISDCAKLYKENLLDKNLLIIYEDKTDKTSTKYFEVLFKAKNFLHLTGIESPKDIPSKRFFELALKSKLPLDRISFKADGTTEMKLSILKNTMKIHKLAKMVGYYNDTKPQLKTEKIAGTISMCVGFVEDNNIYVPNTVLKEDVRNVTNSPQSRILAIYSKDKSEEKYSERTYLAKNINDTMFPKEILELITKLDNKL